MNTLYKTAVFALMYIVSSGFLLGFGQTITHPSTGTSTTTITCGSTYSYYDTGGPDNGTASGANYSNDENTLMTICPSTAGQYVSVNMNDLQISADDFLYVFDGDHGSSQIINTFTGTTTPGGTITASSNNASGCLSFRFYSNNATTSTGWDMSVTCVGTPAAAPSAPTIEDCAGAQVICSDSPLVGGTSGAGVNELPNSVYAPCLYDPGEAQSQWYVFSSLTDGTIGFEIVPNSGTDYDWAVWGPYSSLQCPTFTGDVSLRCNASSLANSGPVGETGLVAGATDTIEENGTFAGEVTDGDLKLLDVKAGEVYVMMLDNWSASTVGFQLNWSLTNGATLDCSPPLPVSLNSFTTRCDTYKTILDWSTSTETNNDYFEVQRSVDGYSFHEIGRVSGHGTSTSTNYYTFVDEEQNSDELYYRLKQVDFNGAYEYHPIVASTCRNDYFNVVQSNLADDQLNLSIQSPNRQALTVRLYSSTGQLLLNKKVMVESGLNRLNYLSNINSSGIYLLSITGSNHSTSVKLFGE